MHVSRVIFPIGLLPLLGACASPGVQFYGRAQPSITSASAFSEVESLPEGYERIGELSARCRLVQGKQPDKGARLVDVDCGESRLTAALYEKAAEVGGEILVGRHCRSRVESRDDVSQTLSVSCTAEVARPGEDALGRRPLVSAVLGETDAPRASEAWKIRVSFTKAPEAPTRAARRAEDVREVPYMPVSHVRLGDIVTSCKCSCTEEGVRLGLMAAAGRFGASDVVDVRCAAKHGGFTCSGTAATYESDPVLDPAAR